MCKTIRNNILKTQEAILYFRHFLCFLSNFTLEKDFGQPDPELFNYQMATSEIQIIENNIENLSLKKLFSKLFPQLLCVVVCPLKQ